jgi:y4mF family transcriptional regulator
MVDNLTAKNMPRAARRTVDELRKTLNPIAIFVRERRKRLGYTQEELAERSGTSLGFIKALELGKNSVRVDKVNQLLALFGARLEPVNAPREGDQ